MILFLLTRLLRGVTIISLSLTGLSGFLLTRLLRGVTYNFVSLGTVTSFLLTRLLRGVTHRKQYQNNQYDNFYSHASCEA